MIMALKIEDKGKKKQSIKSDRMNLHVTVL